VNCANDNLVGASFWRDGFVDVETLGQWPPDTGIHFKIMKFDPESGRRSPIEGIEDVLASSYPTNFEFGGRLFFETSSGTFEYVDSKLTPSGLKAPLDPDPHPKFDRFLYHNEPVWFEPTYDGEICVAVFSQGRWSPQLKVVVPDLSRPRTISGVTCKIGPFGYARQVYDGKENHLFVITDQELLHKRGFELIDRKLLQKRAIASMDEEMTTVDAGSALFPANSDIDLEGWRLVRGKFVDESNLITTTPSANRKITYLDLPVLVDHQPAVVTIPDQGAPFTPVARLYQFVNSQWVPTSTLQMPCGAERYNVGIRQNGDRSYLAVATSIGQTHFHTIESEGFRKIRSSDPPDFFRLFDGSAMYCFIGRLGLVLGGLLAFFYVFLMWLGTVPTYEFGIQAVILANPLNRGIARLIDLCLIAGSAWFLGSPMTRNFDWANYVAAQNARLNDPTFQHPLITQGRWMMTMLVVWFVLMTLTLVIMQGRWGITPGKWLLRLRTVRTSLRPSGFARSLAREIVLVVDCLCGLCWTPGILCIALTTTRQRLGDLVADTIVVRASSLNNKNSEKQALRP